MQKFDYRSPRYTVDLPVEFNAERMTLKGRCRDISKEGMKLEFDASLPADARGVVTVIYQNRTLEFNVLRVSETSWRIL
jgi:hypothetical protein